MQRRIATYLLVVAVITAVFPSPAFAIGNNQAPKLINLFFGYEIKPDDPAKLAKWDIVILDMDAAFNFPDRVREIKRLNPNIKLLAYVSSSEINQLRFNQDQRSPGRKLASRIQEGWYMKKAGGARASWWPGTWMLNATDLGPAINGQRWNTFLGPFIRDEVMTSGPFDGVFLDSAYAEVTNTYGKDLDPDLNGSANDAKATDAAWKSGMSKLISNVRSALGPDKLVMNNSTAAYADKVNGVLYENFPRFGWAWPFSELRSTLTKNASPKISAINTNTENQERFNDYRLMRYGLSSALVADAYFSFDAGDAKHHRTWWYDEYDAPLGNVRAPAKLVKGGTGAVPAVWSREYERGIAIVNATNKAEVVTLSGEYERLRGTQDPGTNNGVILNKITVPAQDGVILIRRSSSEAIKSGSTLNGSFVQVFRPDGSRPRNGFFASRDDIPGGARFLVEDVDRDGADDLVFSNAGEVVIRKSVGGEVRFRPFGTRYRGGIELAAGQTNRDTPYELVLAPSGGWEPRIVVANLAGKTLFSWLAYSKSFTGGVTVSIGDLDGDGLREIITGAGRGGGPHVRSFKTDGKLWRGGFFAFDASERGGVYVSVGDIDGDGRDELVTGSGIGAVPRIRVYDADNRRTIEFSLGSGASTIGVKPSLSDIDGDGKKEILVPGEAF
ncbi:VCBS repeat-containing protein [Candidatus Uhrbacteria bacterium]|nr:VCBS repeat-containing protein [Candidatus Uhrbacteria bacterium]